MAPPILLALTVHEASHGLVAWWCGDPTAKMLGRVTLNPMKHLDVLGTVVFFISAMAGAGFGWAKPVPVNGANLKSPRRDSILISAAGPVVNILTAVLLALLAELLAGWGLARSEFGATVIGMLKLGVIINGVFAFFNLIPLPPLDGSGILMGLLPPRAAMKYQSFGRYGFLILLGLLFLPRFLPGFPNIIQMLVVYPAFSLFEWLLPGWRF